MKKTVRYEFEGVTLDIPLRYDEKMDIYLEEYPDFMETPVWTPEGYPVMFAGEDACEHGECETAGRCTDCGSCMFYRPAARHTWIGVCGQEQRRRI